MLERLLSDWPLKIVALVLAFALWVSVVGEKRIVRDLEVALDSRLPKERIFSVPPPTEVVVRLEGPESVVRKLDPVLLSVRLDLTDVPPGEREVQLTEADLIGKPNRVDVAFFSPDRIKLSLDERERRELPVAVEFTGTPPDGYQQYGYTVNPRTVVVEGPLSEVSRLTQIRTDPIPLERSRHPFAVSVDAVPEGSQVRLLDPRPVHVEVVINASAVTRIFDAVPVAWTGSGARPEIDPARVRVTVEGPPDLLGRIAPGQIHAQADGSDLGPGSQSVQVTASVDGQTDPLSSVRVRSVEPGRVRIRVQRSESS